MTPLIKAQFRERLMEDLAERSLPGIPAYIALWSVIIFATGFHHTHTTVAYSAWLGFLVVSTLRIVYQFTYQRLYRLNPALNRVLFLISILTPTALWSALFIFCILGPNTDNIRILMVMATAGLCSGAMTSFAPDRKIAHRLLEADHSASLYQHHRVPSGGNPAVLPDDHLHWLYPAPVIPGTPRILERT